MSCHSVMPLHACLLQAGNPETQPLDLDPVFRRCDARSNSHSDESRNSGKGH